MALILLLACSGQHVVAGEEESKADQLRESVPAWCKSICARLSQCELDTKCTCTPDSCSCPGRPDEDCVEDCQQEMALYTQGPEACALVGQRFKDCVDHEGCEVLTVEGLCLFEGRDSCVGTDSVVSYGGPNFGTAGSASYGPSAVSCQQWSGSGGTGAQGWPAVVCEESHQGCSDGHDYLVYCVRTSEKVTSCSCLRDQQVVGGFDPNGACPNRLQINAGCGWNLAPE